MRIVIADDAEDLRYLLTLKLGRAGFDVVGEAGNGKEALSVVEATRPHAIVLDLAMPVMDGLQAIPEIRLLAPTTKIVVLSGFESELGDRAISFGAHAFLSKSDDLNRLVPLLQSVIGAA